MSKAGFVTVAGLPNVGKSTLLNRLVGQKLSIVSPKPQTTRDRVVGIRTDSGVQMVFLDTPGLLEPSYELQRAMRAVSLRALREADVIIHVADAAGGAPVPLPSAAGITSPRAPVIVALNKADLLGPAARRALAPDGSLLISARTGEGIPELLTRCAAALPESPFLYPEDDISTQTVRFFAAELIRETALEQLGEELPYSVACQIEEFRETGSPGYIRAVLYVERESQKRMVIGSGGRRVRSIGQAARGKIEALVGYPVYLDLWVKVLPNWRKDVTAMARFGYHAKGTGE